MIIGYVHLASLGGFRHAKAKSVNTGWRNVRFRGYADYMQTQGFEEGLKELNDRRKKRRVCVMCSEAVWWRCHRRMIADAEVVRGIPVKHVMSETTTKRHELTEFAMVKQRQRYRCLHIRAVPNHETFEVAKSRCKKGGDLVNPRIQCMVGDLPRENISTAARDSVPSPELHLTNVLNLGVASCFHLCLSKMARKSAPSSLWLPRWRIEAGACYPFS